LQIEFSAVVQSLTDSEGGEVSSDAIWRIFQDEYLPRTDASLERWGRHELYRTSVLASSASDGATELTAEYRIADETSSVTAVGDGPVDAFLNGLNSAGRSVVLFDSVVQARSSGSVAAAYVDLEVDGQRLWGVGIDGDRTRASCEAIISALSRAARSSREKVTVLQAAGR